MPSFVIALMLVKRMFATRRDVITGLILPAVVLAVIVGVFASQMNEKAHIKVLNGDTGAYGQHLVSMLEKESRYEIEVYKNGTEEQLKQMVQDGDADASVIIPASFSSSLLAGNNPQIIMYRMNEQLWNASLLLTLQAETDRMQHAAQLLAGSGSLNEVNFAKLLEQDQKQLITSTKSDSKLGSTISQPMVIGLMLMFVLLLVTRSITLILEDREQRTMARMFTAPVRAYQIALGNFLGSFLVGTIQVAIMVALSCYVFGYDPGFAPLELFVLLECFLLAAVGLSSAFAGLVRNGMQMGQISAIIITPTCMLSGCFWPISMMPEYMQKLANLVPQKWVLEAADRLSAGGGASDIAIPLAVILLFALVLLAFGAAVLRPNRKAVS
ncbi:ABC transporter permease [Paenibacillus xylaniclasticus]|uniref:ABC transporter permease n=1 Tax=Paenibacillus xylaniclasticus TaxID=588083 RepID=UPI000FDB269F|nr:MULTISPECIES: ABC transporter permease [Paenibacillus]GFN32040.1 multidrug ABC transporter ATP-binding protein [Paenibacillus curdlanolyticus]